MKRIAAVARPARQGSTTSRTVVWTALQASFSAHGFRVAESSLRRIVPPAVQVVHARYRTDRRAGGLGFTIDLGVFFPQAYAKIRSLRARKAPRRGCRDCMCTIRCNIGALLGPTMTEHWWSFPRGADAPAIRELVADAVDNAAIPWLERFSNPRLAMDETDRFDALSLALMLGDVDTARRLAHLAEVESNEAARVVDWARKRWLVP